MTNMQKTILAENYRKFWEKKTKKQIEKEIKSWQKYFDKHGQAYAFHGAGMTPPNTLADGEKITILKELINEKNI